MWVPGLLCPCRALSVQPMAKYLSLISVRHPLFPCVLLITLALFLETLNHKRGATQSAQEKTPGGDTQCQGLLQLRDE